MSKQYLTVGEVAKRTGVSVRTLHFYEKKGLLSPSFRTDSGYRQYTVEDLLQLQKIKSLQQLGMSLAEIKTLDSQKSVDIVNILQSHIECLKNEIKRQNELVTRLEFVAQVLITNQQPSIDMLVDSLEVTVMNEKYYSKEQLAELQKRQQQLSPNQQKAIEQEWQGIFEQFKRLQSEGKPIDCSKAQTLAKRCHELIDEFTGGSAEMRKSFSDMYQTEGGAKVLQQHGMDVDEAVFSYLAKAMKYVRENS